MKELKILEWNINGRSSMGWNDDYYIKDFVIDRIMKEEAHIIILVEFAIGKGWDYFQSQLQNNNYIWFMTYTSPQNGVLIAIKTDIEGLNTIGDNIKVTHENIPNSLDILSVNLKYDEKQICLIGTRIRVKNKNYKDRGSQLSELVEYVRKIKEANKDISIIIAGDFNHGKIHGDESGFDESVYKKKKLVQEPCSYHRIKNLFKEINCQVYTPVGEEKDIFSWSGGKYFLKLDHLIISDDLKVKGKDMEPEINYHWDFVTTKNGYGVKKPKSYKSESNSRPDHAILIAVIK